MGWWGELRIKIYLLKVIFNLILYILTLYLFELWKYWKAEVFVDHDTSLILKLRPRRWSILIDTTTSVHKAFLKWFFFFTCSLLEILITTGFFFFLISSIINVIEITCICWQVFFFFYHISSIKLLMYKRYHGFGKRGLINYFFLQC